MRAIVTGGAGFIGSTLVDRLLAEGDEVLAIDDFSTGTESNLTPKATLERLSVEDQRVAPIVERFRPEVVYHLAAQASVPVSVKDPMLDARSNVLGLINVCEATSRAGARKIVFASSGGTVYGEPAALPVPESHQGVPVSPYGITKRVAHDYLSYYRATHGLDYTALALANVYGPRQDPHGESGVVAIFTERLIRGQECVIFGDGEYTRDYVFVDDVAEAFVRSASKGSGEVVNIGTSIETTVNQLYAAIASAFGTDAKPSYGPPRKGDLRRISLAVDKARAILGWEPSTQLPTGIAKTVAWFRDRAG